MTYCSWENTLVFYLIGSKASIKIDNLCKWGPSTFKFQKRVIPSGKPKTISNKLILSDPTWDLELKYFNYNLLNIFHVFKLSFESVNILIISL